MKKDYTDLNISIVLYKNSIEEICKLLNSLSNFNSKVFVIDNSPTNILASSVKNYSFTTYIFNNKNLGYGSAHNIAIGKSISTNTKYHIVLNPDIEIDCKVIEQLVHFMDNNLDVGLCMPNIVYPDMKRQHLCKLLPTPFNLVFRRFFPFKSLISKYDNLFKLQDADYNNVFEVPSLSGCFMFLRTSILAKTGGFDERFFMYCEDIDLCRKTLKYSKSKYVPTSAVIHHYNKESYRSNRLLLFHLTSAIQYFNKWGWFLDKERKEINKKTLKQLKLM